jgi:hypothetical protein
MKMHSRFQTRDVESGGFRPIHAADDIGNADPSEDWAEDGAEDGAENLVEDCAEDRERLFVDAPIFFRSRILRLAFAAAHPPDPSMKAKPVENESQAYEG